MMTHVVLLKIQKDAPADDIQVMFTALGGLKNKISGILSFTGGPYSSPEGLNRGFTHGFVMKFSNAAARDIYLDHPEHVKVKELVLGLLDGGLDGVVAFDFDS
jgi:hypothetical protein